VQANLSGQARSALHAVLTSVGTSTTDFLDLVSASRGIDFCRHVDHRLSGLRRRHRYKMWSWPV